MYFIGIDPGAKGALSVISEGGALIETSVYSLPNYRHILSRYDETNAIACVEKVHAMPRQGVSSCFTFGKNLGLIEGLLYSQEIPFTEVPPQTWMKAFNLLKPHTHQGKRDKSSSIALAHSLFPGVPFLPTKRCKKESDGIAESLLIAEYGRVFLGKNSIP